MTVASGEPAGRGPIPPARVPALLDEPPTSTGGSSAAEQLDAIRRLTGLAHRDDVAGALPYGLQRSWNWA